MCSVHISLRIHTEFLLKVVQASIPHSHPRHAAKKLDRQHLSVGKCSKCSQKACKVCGATWKALKVRHDNVWRARELSRPGPVEGRSRARLCCESGVRDGVTYATIMADSDSRQRVMYFVQSIGWYESDGARVGFLNRQAP